MTSCRDFPRIKVVRAYVVEAPSGDQGADCHDVDDHHWINGHPVPIANPMSGYPQYREHRKSWGINALGSLVVEVRPGQRRSQVSLVGGADRIPGGGINLNTYTYKMSRRAA